MVQDNIVKNSQKIQRLVAYLNENDERVEEPLDDVIVFRATGTVVAFPSGEPIEPVGTACEAVAIEISLFTKDGGDLTKKVHWNADHTGIFSDSRDCKMATGVMARVPLPDWRDLGRGLPLFPGNTALALGRMTPELPEAIHLVTKKSPECCRPGYASRTGDNLIFAKGKPAVLLLDFDTKGMTAENKARLDELGGFFGALKVIWPGFEKIGYIARRSTSAGIYDATTGQRFGEGGWHVYVLINDGTKAEALLKALHQRAWLNGLGWFRIGEAGQFLERSIIDTSVGGPERLVFEANPELDPGLAQDFRPAELHDGEIGKLTFALKATELDAFSRALSAAKASLHDEAMEKRQAFRAGKKDEAIRAGMDPERAEAMAKRWTQNILRSGVPIVFEDKDIGVKYVYEILADPKRFDGEVCYDPIEGEAYGRANARFFADRLCINCFAHGGSVFFLRHDATSVAELIERDNPTKAVQILCSLASIIDFDVAERKTLVKFVGDRAGCGERTAGAALKETLATERERRAEEARDKADRESTTIRLPALPADTKINPVMDTWDDILAHATAVRGDDHDFAEPPMRNAEGWPIEIRWRDPPGLHTLSSAGANAEEDENSRLPAPEQFLLSKHDQFSLEIEVGKYITFVQRTLDGSRDVAPPEKFTLHYLKLRGSAAPRVHAILTLAIVLPDRTLLAENGLDRERKVAFRIDRTLLRWIPKREDCTPEAVRAAYRFLTEEWLIDVLTDRKGKATLIAYALSIIERCLIPNRPVFTVTAGQRGGGKTTVLMMIILAVLGIKPAAAAWSSDPTERKKALFAYLLEGLPALVWDNIPRGAVISCPSIERSCTAEGYSDRILGITGIGQADAYTIQAFTGNCIRCASDLASRNLTVTITTDRPDPENRTFVNSDPLAWTLDHRGKILHSLFMVLMAPRGAMDEGTRFKEWQRLVGSAVEFAANAPETPEDQRISFEHIFIENERESDDEAINYGAILQALYGHFPPPVADPNAPKAALEKGREFNTTQVLNRVGGSGSKPETEDGEPIPEELVNLRFWLTTRNAKAPTMKSIPKALNSIKGTTVCVEGGVMTLRSRWDTRKKSPVFWVEFRPELNPDGTKTPEAEEREREIAAATAKIEEEAKRSVERAMQKAAWKPQGTVNPFAPARPPNGETSPFQAAGPLRPPFQPGEPPFSTFDMKDDKKQNEQP